MCVPAIPWRDVLFESLNEDDCQGFKLSIDPGDDTVEANSHSEARIARH